MNYYKNSTDTVPMLLLLPFSLSFALLFQAEAVTLPGPSCLKSCGDVEIVFPFGIGDDCAMDGFKLECSSIKDRSNNLTYLHTYYDKVQLLNISLIHGQIRVKNYISYMCYNRSTGSTGYDDYWPQEFSNPPFTFSEKLNIFTVVGVNTLAYMVGSPQVIGCVSQSSPYPLYYDKNDTRTARDGVCDGVGCCQVALSSNMSYYAVNFDESYNTTNISITNSADYCGYAAIMETSAFKFRTTYLYTNGFIDEHDGSVPVILNWAVGNESCDVARMKTYSYACRSNYSVCTNSASGPGYLCNCAEGYQGNPYLPGGCQDVNECEGNPCSGCINTLGSFSCPTIRSLNVGVLIAVGSSIGVVIVVVVITCTYSIHERKKLTNIKQKYFRQHGGMLLLHEMSLKQGTAFSIFTEAELAEATDKFDDKNIIGRGGHGTVYKGTLKDGTMIAVKRCVMISEQQQEFGKEMLILSQINHKNIVKVLGCCLEVDVPNASL